MSEVRAFSTSRYLMIDADIQTKKRVVDWSKRYSKKYRLGNVLIFKTSNVCYSDLYGKKRYNFAIIFGRRLPWQEILWHLRNALKDKMVDKKVVELSRNGFITERVSRKNSQIEAPTLFKYNRVSDRWKDREGCYFYLRWRVVSAKMEEIEEDEDDGEAEDEPFDSLDPDMIPDPLVSNSNPTIDRWIGNLWKEAEKLSEKRRLDYSF